MRARGALVARLQEVDRAGDAGVEVVGREAADLVDARAAGGQRRPIVLLADAERGDDADAGDGDDRPALMIGRLGHGLSSPRPLDQRRALVAVEADRRCKHRLPGCRRNPSRLPRRRQDRQCRCGLPMRQARWRRELRFLEMAGERREARGTAGRPLQRLALGLGRGMRARRAGDRQRRFAVRIGRAAISSAIARRSLRRAAAFPEATLSSLGIGGGAARFGMLARFQHQEGGARSGHHAAALRASRSQTGRQAPRCR